MPRFSTAYQRLIACQVFATLIVVVCISTLA